MYAVYRVVPGDEIRGRPVRDYVLRKGKICERQLITTVRTEQEAIRETDRYQATSKHEIYWVNID